MPHKGYGAYVYDAGDDHDSSQAVFSGEWLNGEPVSGIGDFWNLATGKPPPRPPAAVLSTVYYVAVHCLRCLAHWFAGYVLVWVR